MPRSITAAVALAVCATGLVTTPASASASEAFYGFAWADGATTLRITPAKAVLVKGHGAPRYKLTPVSGAKERRLNYSGADFRRITAECRLKESEGVVRVDGKGLGTTRCRAGDLTFALGLGPVPIRVSPGTTKRIHEILATPSGSKTAYGTIRRQNDTTVVFTAGGRSVKLGYTALSFSRVTGRCGDGWLTNHVNARHDGLGTKECTTSVFTKILKGVKYPVLAKVDYNPGTGQLLQVWEVFADA
ncbi:hypothetical protein OHA77_24060 [Streptosporangium sp. NBC_01639]|uniref:hypothetical protein n=1 Tax=Streptosporangium sp. NBC_01639 TaxID=2975948 RepID=UPI00386C29E2|nr:hypothetical protein OHA77_24060 [Streptosporangium sp. NBC_01639]